MILYVHIPKTAGTSFRQGLVQVFGRENCLFDYGPDELETDKSIRTLYKERDFAPNYVKEIARKKKVHVIGGHFPLSRYNLCFPEAIIVSFLREPLQRSYSEFLHWQRHKGYSKSFEHFFQQEGQINLQSKWLDQLPADGLVGITEHYRQSLNMINEVLGTAVPVLKLNFYRKKIHSSYLTEILGIEIVSNFYKINAQDVFLYKKELDNFLKKYSSNINFIKRLRNPKGRLSNLLITNRF